MKRVLASLTLGLGLSVASLAHAEDPVRLVAAGSLTEALTEMARSFEDIPTSASCDFRPRSRSTPITGSPC